VSETKLKYPLDAKKEVMKVMLILAVGILAIFCLKGCNDGGNTASGVLPFTTDRR
jgi:hypothetical protein